MTKEEFRSFLKSLPLETIETIIEAAFYSTTLNRFGVYKMEKFDEVLCDDGCLAVAKAVLNSPGFDPEAYYFAPYYDYNGPRPSLARIETLTKEGYETKLTEQLDEIVDEMIYSASEIVYDLEVDQPELADKFYEYVKRNNKERYQRAIPEILRLPLQLCSKKGESIMTDHMKKINSSFTDQAKSFENANMNFSKKEYLDYTMKAIGAARTDLVLEPAAGTCVCGRTLAPMVQKVTCLDATPAMLDVLIEDLPFPDASFDIVMTRLSFHHFQEMEKPFSEMNRVLKPGGKLVIIDMEAAEESVRETEDGIERLRDCSHVRNRSRQEFVSLYNAAAYKIWKEESTKIPVRLSAWMELTKTPEAVQKDIVQMMDPPRASIPAGKTGKSGSTSGG